MAINPNEPDAQKYKLIIANERGEVIASRTMRLSFEGIDGTRVGGWASAEEYFTATKAKELYRDAAFAASKWPKVA